jgi:hypothetical protein
VEGAERDRPLVPILHHCRQVFPTGSKECRPWSPHSRLSPRISVQAVRAKKKRRRSIPRISGKRLLAAGQRGKGIKLVDLLCNSTPFFLAVLFANAMERYSSKHRHVLTGSSDSIPKPLNSHHGLGLFVDLLRTKIAPNLSLGCLFYKLLIG